MIFRSFKHTLKCAEIEHKTLHAENKLWYFHQSSRQSTDLHCFRITGSIIFQVFPLFSLPFSIGDQSLPNACDVGPGDDSSLVGVQLLSPSRCTSMSSSSWRPVCPTGRGSLLSWGSRWFSGWRFGWKKLRINCWSVDIPSYTKNDFHYIRVSCAARLEISGWRFQLDLYLFTSHIKVNAGN